MEGGTAGAPMLGFYISTNPRADDRAMQWSELQQQDCSMARSLAVIGDRWTLLILRECFLRVRRFDDYQARLGIGRPILADRLAKLVEHGVLAKVAYQANPVRHEYRLTRMGLDLYPVVMAIVHWGDEHLADGAGRPVIHYHQICGHDFSALMVCSSCGEELEARDVEVRPGRGRSGAGLPDQRRQAITPSASR